MVNLAVSEFAVLGCVHTVFRARITRGRGFRVEHTCHSNSTCIQRGIHVQNTCNTRTKILRASAPLEPSGWNSCSATTQSLQNHNVVSYSLDTM